VIPHAKGYELTVANTRNATRVNKSGPPFPDDHWDDYPAHFDVHPHFHWFALSGYSTGTGCAQAILAFEGAYKIVRSRVSLERKYQRRLRPPRRGYKVVRYHGPGESPRIDLPPGSWVMLRKVGRPAGALITDEHTRRSSIGTGTFLNEETILETDRRSAVIIYDKFERRDWSTWTRNDGVVIGPGMKVRIVPGKRVEVLHQDPHASWENVPKIQQGPHSTNIGGLAPRG
jgi:hypothetical protein